MYVLVCLGYLGIVQAYMYVLVCLGYVGIAGIHVCISVSRVCW